MSKPDEKPSEFGAISDLFCKIIEDGGGSVKRTRLPARPSFGKFPLVPPPRPTRAVDDSDLTNPETFP